MSRRNDATAGGARRTQGPMALSNGIRSTDRRRDTNRKRLSANSSAWEALAPFCGLGVTEIP
eukprot:scaffold32250_cov31-Tisochrysis_lutea.AAC.4